jgi:hypothetical protein
VQAILEGKLRKSDEASFESWFEETEKEISILAVVDFSQHSHPTPEQSLNTGVVLTRPLSFKIRISEPPKHQLEIRKLIVTAGCDTNFPILSHGPAKRCPRRKECLIRQAAVFDASAPGKRNAQMFVAPGVLSIIGLFDSAMLELD